MKRDWNLLRQILVDIEEGRSLTEVFPEKPDVWKDIFSLTNEEINQKGAAYREFEAHYVGHLELLLESGFIQGISISYNQQNRVSYDTEALRLTMAGHDLLDTMRTPRIWDNIKSTAKKKGVELSFDAIKVLSVAALNHLLK